MKKNVLLFLFTILITLGFQSCNDENDKVGNTARIQLKLVDAPGDYEQVNIEIIDIQYNSSEDEEGWTSFTPENGYPINIDLTELIAGNDLLLADEIIPSGILNQIRLVLSDHNTIVIEGEGDGDSFETHLDTPSAQQSGLKLKLDTELEPGFSYTFILDWDVQKSIVKAGNSGKYLLKPVIRVNTEVNSGSISGKVIGEVQGDEIDGAVPLNDILVSVYKDGDTDVTTETLTDDEGNFLIQGLDAGTYKIVIEHTSYINYESDDISVTVGMISDAGTIELLVPVTE